MSAPTILPRMLIRGMLAILAGIAWPAAAQTRPAAQQVQVPPDAIVGVQPAALDQPRIYMNLRRTPAGPILAATVGPDTSGGIEAFLDTGSSGIVLSQQTARGLGVHTQLAANGAPAHYEDVGVGGSEQFTISEPLYASFASYAPAADPDNLAAYGKPVGPLRIQLRGNGGILEKLMGGIDIAGMPAIEGKVVVIDPQPVNTFADTLRTSLHEPGDRSIPLTDRHVRLTWVSFQPFTRTTPAGAQPPTQEPSPMIGPDPFGPQTAPTTQPIIVQYGGHTASISMLLDMGAAASMISTRCAAQLGVRYAADGKTLLGVPRNEQFSLDIGGIGGNKTSTGFYLDLLVVPTVEGKPITYAKAPVLVTDISLTNQKTGQPFTLDGVFGMNFLVASANVQGGVFPDIENLTQGPFTAIVLDQQRGLLGLK